MANTGNTPKNLNHLREKNFISKMSIEKLSDIDFFVTTVTIPGFNVGEVIQRGINKAIPRPGNTLEKDPLTVQFLLDEDMNNWLAIYEWMTGMTFPIDFEQSRTWIKKQKDAGVQDYYSNITIFLLKNSMRPNLALTFHNAFPTNLDGFDMTVAGSDEPIVANAVFSFSHMTLETNL